ncbi:hypothetical protein PCASD_20172 [Puccinia coronata f. sp. avenae]|uniref:Uncharacterized protein n=1 Tax=Puccinia coronata f. sp. avenae TaxID=200324 RepID=A0A2N5TME8_9BASI|nr:hypothetical protein PCASD_20172 [Puccinia coronata f. sp. avenae]
MTPRSSTTPQPTPLRQSTRIVTPSRSHPNYVRTSRDSQRQAVVQSSQEVPSNNHSESEAESVTQTRTNQLCRKKRKQKRPAAKRKKTKTVIVTDNNSEAADDIVDFVQDSDNENAKVKKSQTEKISPLDNVRDYFEPPFHANEADKGEKMMYKCKWCTVVYKKGRGTNSNLYTAGADLRISYIPRTAWSKCCPGWQGGVLQTAAS